MRQGPSRPALTRQQKMVLAHLFLEKKLSLSKIAQLTGLPIRYVKRGLREHGVDVKTLQIGQRAITRG